MARESTTENSALFRSNLSSPINHLGRLFLRPDIVDSIHDADTLKELDEIRLSMVNAPCSIEPIVKRFAVASLGEETYLTLLTVTDKEDHLRFLSHHLKCLFLQTLDASSTPREFLRLFRPPRLSSSTSSSSSTTSDPSVASSSSSSSCSSPNLEPMSPSPAHLSIVPPLFQPHHLDDVSSPEVDMSRSDTWSAFDVTMTTESRHQGASPAKWRKIREPLGVTEVEGKSMEDDDELPSGASSNEPLAEDECIVVDATTKSPHTSFPLRKQKSCSMPEHTALQCSNLHCRLTFDSWFSKNQCASCGCWFCQSCVKTIDPGWWSSGRTYCTQCFDVVSLTESLHVRALQLLVLSVPQLRLLVEVSPEWKRGATYWLTKVFNMQYLPPTRPLTTDERSHIWASRACWCGHSLWLTQLMRSTDWRNPQQAKEASQLLVSTPRRYKCESIFCSSLCSDEFTIGQNMILLSKDCRYSAGSRSPFISSNSVPASPEEKRNSISRDAIVIGIPGSRSAYDIIRESLKQVRKFAVDNLRRILDEHSDESHILLRSFLPVMVHHLRYEHKPKSGVQQQSELAQFLFECVNRFDRKYQSQFANCFYYELRYAESSSNPKLAKLYRDVSDWLITQLSHHRNTRLIHQIKSGSAIVDIFLNASNKTRLGHQLKKYHQLYLPIDPDVQFSCFHADKITEAASATAPVIVSGELMLEVEEMFNVPHTPTSTKRTLPSGDPPMQSPVKVSSSSTRVQRKSSSTAGSDVAETWNLFSPSTSPAPSPGPSPVVIRRKALSPVSNAPQSTAGHSDACSASASLSTSASLSSTLCSSSSSTSTVKSVPTSLEWFDLSSNQTPNTQSLELASLLVSNPSLPIFSSSSAVMSSSASATTVAHSLPSTISLSSSWLSSWFTPAPADSPPSVSVPSDPSSSGSPSEPLKSETSASSSSSSQPLRSRAITVGKPACVPEQPPAQPQPSLHGEVDAADSPSVAKEEQQGTLSWLLSPFTTQPPEDDGCDQVRDLQPHYESKSKPTDKIFQMIFKKEDIRKDQIVMNAVHTFTSILKTKSPSKLDLHVLTYNVLPISSKEPPENSGFRDVGFIQFVRDAKTISDIHKGGDSIQNWIGNRPENRSRTVDELRYVWTKSMAAWTVFTLLLGFGDRHLANLMATNDGRVFHIDFGFVLGEDPKPLMPTIRLDSALIEPMGGRNSHHYEEYFRLCREAFLTLRRHYFDIYVLLMHLPMSDPRIPNWNISMDDLNKQLNQRFLHGHSEEDAWRYFKSMLIAEQDAPAHMINDKWRTVKEYTSQLLGMFTPVVRSRLDMASQQLFGP